MMADLVAGGIPQDKIILDYAGFRTLDSIVRCKAVFGETNITIISQRFHNERALYLAQKNDIEAVAFNAKDVHRKAGLKVYVREYFARVKMMLDLIFGKEPKFYGPKIEIK
jgi:SanA protein